jgi:DNA-binding response OmpR family regulator
MRILIIEDDRDLVNVLRRSLTEAGYAVDVAYDGEEGEIYAISAPYDVIILDIMLPHKDGFEVCMSLRQNKINARILMLTAKDAVNDKVKGLNCGADDYLTKPFDFSELSARIRTLLRREIVRGVPIIQIGDLSLDTIKREVTRGGVPIKLTAKEFGILEYFMMNPGAVINRKMLEEHVWNFALNSESNLIEAYIRRIRQKINANGKEDLIETIRGSGYRLKQL